MKEKKASILVVLMILSGFVLGPALLVYWVDPFQVYHRSFLKQTGYGSNQWYQHAGWVNTVLSNPEEKYSAVVLGSSVAANYDQHLFESKLPSWGRVMNLSVNGGVPKMQSSIAESVLNKAKNVKHIFWDVHYFYAIGSEVGKDLDFPYYLYDKELHNDTPYFFNSSNVYSSIKEVFGNYSEFSYDIINNGPWYQGLLNAGRFDVFSPVEKKKEMLGKLNFDSSFSPQKKEEYSRRLYPNVDKHLLDIVMPICNSDIKVDIVFSPTTRYFYATTLDVDFLYKQIYMRRYIVEKVQRCNNVRVFAFDNEDWITTNLANYADFFHFDKKINGYILESIASDKHQLTLSNIDEYERQFIAAINAYPQLFKAQLQESEQH